MDNYPIHTEVCVIYYSFGATSSYKYTLGGRYRLTISRPCIFLLCLWLLTSAETKERTRNSADQLENSNLKKYIREEKFGIRESY